MSIETGQTLSHFRILSKAGESESGTVYRTRDENLTNVQRGIETLRALGIEPSGFVAPGGRFNRGLLEALEALRVGHSSEFGLAYDELPFSPGQGRLLQIPIHPVCLGLFLAAVEQQRPASVAATQQAVRAAIDYFRETARAKYRSAEPVFFYGHPTGRLGRYPEVLRAIFEVADGFSSVWKTTLSEFAAWWRARAQTELSVARHDEKYVVTAGRQPPGYAMAIDYWRGPHVARMPLKQSALRFSPASLAYENRTARPTVRPVRIDHPEGLRGRIRRWIDWERETPIEQIGPDTWRNWAKRTLRRLRR